MQEWSTHSLMECSLARGDNDIPGMSSCLLYWLWITMAMLEKRRLKSQEYGSNS